MLGAVVRLLACADLRLWFVYWFVLIWHCSAFICYRLLLAIFRLPARALLFFQQRKKSKQKNRRSGALPLSTPKGWVRLAIVFFYWNPVDNLRPGGCPPLKPLSFAAALFWFAIICGFCCLIDVFDLLGTFFGFAKDWVSHYLPSHVGEGVTK